MDSAKPPAKKPNTSLETRKTVRREKADRRIDIRFEPTKKTAEPIKADCLLTATAGAQSPNNALFSNIPQITSKTLNHSGFKRRD